MDRFPAHFKSTIAVLVNQLAQANGFAYFEGDAVGMWATVQESQGPALGHELHHWAEDPMDPCYEAIIEIGPQTSLDADQIKSMEAIGFIGSAFRVGTQISIADHTGTVAPVTFVGVATVVENMTQPSDPGKTSSMRMWRIKLKATRFVR